MSGVLAIVKKELRSYFSSMVGWIIIGIFTFIMGVIFAKFVDIYERYMASQRFGQGGGITLDKLAMYLYQNMSFFLLLMAPIVTMRIFAEEKRQHTLELLFTAPIRGFELVLGKFLAAYLMMVLMVAVSFLYAFFMIIWGNPEVPIIATTYLGLFLSVACYVALGGLISALTNSQAIAAVATFIALLFLFLLQTVGQGVTTTWGAIQWGPLLMYLSPQSHFNSSFGEGLIHIRDVVYYLTFCAFFLFLTHRVVESNRWR